MNRIRPRNVHDLTGQSFPSLIPRGGQTVASDVVVVGSGVAGLAAALALSSRADQGGATLAPLRVTLLTKTELFRGGSSSWAQGGVAAALGPDDSPRLHADDTLAAAAGLADGGAVAALTAEGPRFVRELIALGARFDRGPGGELRLGREGAHGRRRILHAGGDATGAEMVRVLADAVRDATHVTVAEGVFAEDLVLDGNGDVCGVLARPAGGRAVYHRAPAVIFATGGFGQLYARTTNPPAVTGDGLAMAARAGAELADLEFVQFHPTALDVDADPLPLVTEALRGEGAILLNDRGERFMASVHPQLELAPRDIVARAIFAQQQDGRRVVLDASGAVGAAFPERFPTVFEKCRAHGIDPRRQPIPVTPAAHYAMAGIAVDTLGRSSLGGLWVCGEAAASGVHGANRLASNSLLEALVFGARVAEDVHASPRTWRAEGEVVWRQTGPSAPSREDVAGQVRRLMWDRAGLVRDRAGLESVLVELERLTHQLPPVPSEASNLLTIGRLVTAAALAREESRGAHYRVDFPEAREDGARRRLWTYAPDAEFPLVPAMAVAEREIA